ncbi:L,D-transpeptidase [Blastomonas sp. SL216]|uniref:L,D-transpeptidase n=1 Tax=Blastomonas sp. SL216 TaxID=2995169 RepID=UPI0023771BBD|nr:L,D-transpeptidase [Blastomonas sp. SL216]
MRRALTALALLVLTPGAPLQAQTPSIATDGAIEALKPGEFLWAPAIAPEGPVTIIISLTAQRAYVYRNGLPIGVSTVSTGAKGHETPTGIFVILQKAEKHRSNLYSNALMPMMQRLTWDGIAMHAGNLPGYPASHGCIRLPLPFAKLLFGVTDLGLTVVITDDPLAPEMTAAPGLLDNRPDDDRSREARFRWQPGNSPAGPVSIMVSGRDRRIVVLRNGIEIGSSAIAIDGPVTRTEAFTLDRVDTEGPHWLRLPLPGTARASAAEMTPQESARGHFPDAFRQHIRSVIGPGTTLLITRDSMRSSGTGKAMTILTGEDP